jgi:peptide chain release factor
MERTAEGIPEELASRLARLGVREADLEESFVRSGGPGGQNVNKVATCVVLVHRPTGTTVRCQEERSQGMNRLLARRRLAERMERDLAEAEARRRREAERARRQRRTRSRGAKREMLRDKRHRAGVKQSRRRPGGED